MRKKGFTLIELLGVIIILALLAVLVFPSIINSVRNSSKKTDDLTIELIYNAADLYIDNYKNNFPKINGAKYIIDLKTLVNDGLLIEPIKLSESDDDLTNQKCVQVSYDNDFNYELKNYSECVIRLFDNVNADIDGDRKLTEQDPILLSKYLFLTIENLEFDETLIKGDKDINLDKIINANDINMLSQALGLIVPGILGDVNGDGLITTDDEIVIGGYILSYNTNIVLENSDTNGDGLINIADESCIQRAINIGIDLSDI